MVNALREIIRKKDLLIVDLENENARNEEGKSSWKQEAGEWATKYKQLEQKINTYKKYGIRYRIIEKMLTNQMVCTYADKDFKEGEKRTRRIIRSEVKQALLNRSERH